MEWCYAALYKAELLLLPYYPVIYWCFISQFATDYDFIKERKTYFTF